MLMLLGGAGACGGRDRARPAIRRGGVPRRRRRSRRAGRRRGHHRPPGGLLRLPARRRLDRDHARRRRRRAPRRAAAARRAILLTFDDGYASLYTRVYPLLLAYRMPIVAALQGSWLAPPPGAARWPTAAAACRANASSPASRCARWRAPGWSSSLRTATTCIAPCRPTRKATRCPRAVTRLYADGAYESEAAYRARLADDLRRSRDVIAGFTGRPPRALVWPFGRYSAVAVEIARVAGLSLRADARPRAGQCGAADGAGALSSDREPGARRDRRQPALPRPAAVGAAAGLRRPGSAVDRRRRRHRRAAGPPDRAPAHARQHRGGHRRGGARCPGAASTRPGSRTASCRCAPTCCRGWRGSCRRAPASKPGCGCRRPKRWPRSATPSACAGCSRSRRPGAGERAVRRRRAGSRRASAPSPAKTGAMPWQVRQIRAPRRDDGAGRRPTLWRCRPSREVERWRPRLKLVLLAATGAPASRARSPT